MKFYAPCVLSVAIITASTTAAQSVAFSAGIEAGANYSYFMTGHTTRGYSNGTNWNWKFGPVEGVFFNVPMNQSFALEPAILYSQAGASYNIISNAALVKWTQHMSYLSAPVLLKIRAGNSFAFLIGPELDYLLASNLKDHATSSKSQNENNFERFDIAATGGIQILAESPVSFTLRYTQGLTNITKHANSGMFENSASSTLHNSVVQATVHFRLFRGRQGSIAITTPGLPFIADSDSDGISDNMDKCPYTPGIAKYDGCPIPDTDHDGINDEKDKCPAVPGIAKYDGCPVPDSDGDEIDDDHDKCPTVPGVAKYNGCPVPDADKDGISDEEDRCPYQPGVAANHGCPVPDPVVQDKINSLAKHIDWAAPNGYKLSASSYKFLDEVKELLGADTALKMTVSAYGIKTKDVNKNRTLRRKREYAIKDYFIKKGILQTRIEVESFDDEQANTGKHPVNNQSVSLNLHY